MHRDLVERRRWISEAEHKEGLTLAQLMPGPLAAQLAIYLGYVHEGVLGAGLLVWAVRAPPRGFRGTGATSLALFPLGFAMPGVPVASNETLGRIAWFFTEAGAFVFGSGLAIVPFLYGGVVKEYGWLDDQQFLDAVAVAMITPGPVVITVAFIGFLVGGFTGAVVVLGRRTIFGSEGMPELPKVAWVLATIVLLWKFKRVPEPVIVLGAAVVGLVVYPWVRP